jgi:hypothetical protein
MARYVFVYQGGSMPETDAEREAVMAAWMGWFEGLGSAVIDGGAPFGGSLRVSSAGTSPGAGSAATGYSIVEAGDLDGAGQIAGGCPILAAGGSVDVHEALPM